MNTEALEEEVAVKCAEIWYSTDHPMTWSEMAKAVIPILEKERKEKNSGDVAESYFRGRKDGLMMRDTEIEQYRDRIADLVEQVVRGEYECQARVERIFKEIEELIKWTEKQYDPNLNVGTPESTGGIINLGKEYVLVDKDGWQALKKQEGVE